MFDDLSLCATQHDFITAKGELKANGHPPTPYRHTTFNEWPVNDNSALARRNVRIGLIISKAGANYPPALVMLSELVRCGDLIAMEAELDISCWRAPVTSALSARTVAPAFQGREQPFSATPPHHRSLVAAGERLH